MPEHCALFRKINERGTEVRKDGGRKGRKEGSWAMEKSFLSYVSSNHNPHLPLVSHAVVLSRHAMLLVALRDEAKTAAWETTPSSSTIESCFSVMGLQL